MKSVQELMCSVDVLSDFDLKQFPKASPFYFCSKECEQRSIDGCNLFTTRYDCVITKFVAFTLTNIDKQKQKKGLFRF